MVYFVVENMYLTFDRTHALERKGREFEHGSPIGNSTANLEGIRKLNGIVDGSARAGLGKFCP